MSLESEKTIIPCRGRIVQIGRVSPGRSSFTATYLLSCDICSKSGPSQATKSNYRAAEEAARQPLDEIVASCKGIIQSSIL